MTIVFHKDRDWLQTPYTIEHGLLMDSKNRTFNMLHEPHLCRKLRRCYPRGKVYNNLERLEYFARRGF